MPVVRCTFKLNNQTYSFLNCPATGGETMVGKVKRGHFRLHPQGPMRLSEGCITIVNQRDF